MAESEKSVSIDGHYDWPAIVGDLNRLLRLRTTPIGMKLFESREEMEAIPRIRRPGAIHTTDQKSLHMLVIFSDDNKIVFGIIHAPQANSTPEIHDCHCTTSHICHASNDAMRVG